jgi:hypothetical protein
MKLVYEKREAPDADPKKQKQEPKTACLMCGKMLRPLPMEYHVRKDHLGLPPYRCGVDGCTETFERFLSMTRHKSTLHSTKFSSRRKYACRFKACGQLFSDFSRAKRHEAEFHTLELPYGCTISGCTTRFFELVDRDKHLLKVHGVSSNKYSQKRKREEEQDTYESLFSFSKQKISKRFF